MSKVIEDIAIIMDGNGRWATERLKPRFWGHIKGSQNVSKIVEKAKQLNMRSITLYAFSTENWLRPKDEVDILLKLLKRFLKKESPKILQENIKFNILGDYSGLDTKTIALIESLTIKSKSNTGISLNIAFNYGGRKEIVDSVNRFIRYNPGEKITEELLSNNLYNNELKDVDLIIRTGGDKRISNFLLWQSSYSELFFTDKKWPEFSGHDLEQIINQVSGRERRFGKV